MTARLTCADCRWWHFQPTPEGDSREADNAVGYCRRLPPQRRENGVGAWPITFGGDWCGEYVHKDDVSYQVGQGYAPVS
tara:strand:- start:1251 stop:1487 length:237 start_codon:yes stop_codon:yes gene_type:complete